VQLAAGHVFYIGQVSASGALLIHT